MKKKKLGSTGMETAPLVFGGNVFGWTIDQATSFKVLDAFVGAGYNMIDTADVYSAWVPGNKGGESEAIIGQWLKARGGREKVIIATKLGMKLGPGKEGLSAKYIMTEVEESLQRLQTDYIDLYQSHRDDQATPQEETLTAYQKLIQQGKVRAIGASNFEAPRLKEALKISKENKLPTYATLQPLYNLYDREGFEKELQGVCVENGIGVIPFYSLASGFLTGKYRSDNDLKQSARGTRVSGYMNDRGMKILKALEQVSEAHRCSMATVAVAWLASRPSIAAPIASATSVQQLQDLLKAGELSLSAADISLLDKASSY
jgi:aryl-alcohol dehydrogenase-like predicted oxidoreductase